MERLGADARRAQLNGNNFSGMPGGGKHQHTAVFFSANQVAQQLGDTWGQLVPLGAEADGQRFGEYDALLFRARVVAEARVFF